MPGIFGPTSPADDFTVDSFGVRGPVGASAYASAVQQGFVGSEAQWLQSLAGASAYQVAVALGYAGTPAQWLASLVGPVGPASTVPGPVGPIGPQGPAPSASQVQAAVTALLVSPGIVAQLLASLPNTPPPGGGPFIDNGIVMAHQ